MTKSVTIVFALAVGLTVGIAVGGGARSPGERDSIADLRYFCDGNAIIPSPRQILLADFKTQFCTREQWLLMSIEDLLTVIENGFAVEIGKRHFQFCHPHWFVRNILQIAGNDINPVARKVLACCNTQMRQLQISLDRGRVRYLRQRNAGSIIPGRGCKRPHEQHRDNHSNGSTDDNDRTAFTHIIYPRPLRSCSADHHLADLQRWRRD